MRNREIAAHGGCNLFLRPKSKERATNTAFRWGYTLAGIGVSLGLSMNFEAVTARYVDVRLERKKEVLDAYHGAVKQADPAKAEKAEPKKAKSAAKKKSSDLEL